MNHDARVKDEANLVRKAGNPAVITNTDLEGYEAYMAKRRAAEESRNQIANIEQRVEGLEGKLDQILNLLQGKSNG
uniref:Uncharacterized protein n=1 Tax=Pseudomonas phage Cygsa01 TaxID=3138529 RepID=A0AAU6W5K2_9VIRU